MSSTAGGESSVVQMLGSLYDAIEKDFGGLSARLYRAFRPKISKRYNLAIRLHSFSY